MASFMGIAERTSQVGCQLPRAPFCADCVSALAPQRAMRFSAVGNTVRDLQRIFVVLGYGCHLTERVRGYLAHAAARIEGQGLVITSGGRTALVSAPGVSEAELMAKHLRTLGVALPIEFEETARTTVENLRNVARLIEKRGFAPSSLVIFCDRARQRKIDGLARYFLRRVPFSIDAYDL